MMFSSPSGPPVALGYAVPALYSGEGCEDRKGAIQLDFFEEVKLV